MEALKIVQKHWSKITRSRATGSIAPSFKLNGRDKHGKSGAWHPTILAVYS